MGRWIDRTAPTALAGGYNLDWLPERTTIVPGEAFRIAWRVAASYGGDLHESEEAPPQAPLPWTSASVELALAATGEVLWHGPAFAWPPPVEIGEHPVVGPSGIVGLAPAWPPAGFTLAGPLRPVAPSGRRDLYEGFGERALELRLIGTGAAPNRVGATRSIWVQPAAPRTVSIGVPAFVGIGERIALQASAGSDSAAAAATVDGTLRWAGTWDGAAIEDRSVHLAVPAHERAWTTLTVPGITWEWVDKPTYRVHEDDVERDVSFAWEPDWSDEYGNAYPPIAASPALVRVRVGDTKIAAAHAAETCFWINVGIVVGVAVLTIALTIVSFGAAPAAGAAGAAAAGAAAGGGVGAGAVADLATGLISGVGGAAGAAASYGSASWAAVADDPVAPDPDYWDRLPLPASQPPASKALHAYVRSMFEAQRVAQLILLAAQVEGRVLGARLAGVPAAIELQLAELARVERGLAEAAASLASAKDRAPQELAQIGLDRKQLARALRKLRADGLPGELRERLGSLGVPADLLVQVEEALRREEAERAVRLDVLLPRLHRACLRAAEAALADLHAWRRGLDPARTRAGAGATA
jgi:hypothetical protein